MYNKQKMIKKIIFISAFAIMFNSCVTNKYLTSTTKPSQITSLDYFEPISYIHLIEKKNDPIFNDSLSFQSKMKLDSVIIQNKKKLKIKNKLVINSESLKDKLEREISFLIQTADRNNSVEGIKLTPAIDSIMKSNNQRFALATVSSGFGRRKGNYGGQVAKGIGVGILTLGLYTPVPIKSNLTLYGIIFDSQKNEIAFYRKTNPVEKSPTEKVELEKQLHNLFQDYFYD